MQIKPRLNYFKILEQYPILKDDTNNEICLIKAEYLEKDSEVKKSDYFVIGTKLIVWENKASSYYDIAFWKKNKKELIKNMSILTEDGNSFEINEYEDGQHTVFWNMSDIGNYGLRTKFTFTAKE